MTREACSHKWIDPNDPPIERGIYSPVIGEQRREMKEGHTYECWNCGAKLIAKKGGAPQ